MAWYNCEEAVLRELPTEVSGFVRTVLKRLEQENTFDAPGVIGAVVRAMRESGSVHVRSAAPRAEALLKAAFAPVRRHRVGA